MKPYVNLCVSKKIIILPSTLEVAGEKSGSGDGALFSWSAQDSAGTTRP